MALPPTLGDPGKASPPSLFGLGEGEGGGWHWAVRSRLLSISLQVSYLLGDPRPPPLAGEAASAGHTKGESLGGLCVPSSRGGVAGLGGASSPAGCLGCSAQKQEALMGALVTGLM